MIIQKQKRPTIAGSGISKNIQATSMNNRNLTMALSYPHGQAFLSELVDRFEALLQKYNIHNPSVFSGSEVDAFIALSNLDSDVKRQGVKL